MKIKQTVMTGLVGIVMLVLGGAGTAVAMAATSERTWVPPDDTVVRVTGDAVNGFGIYYYDGSAIFPPTDSESLAECGEYDAWGERVRCRTGVRTWYRDLKTTKRAINWAHYVERHPA